MDNLKLPNDGKIDPHTPHPPVQMPPTQHKRTNTHLEPAIVFRVHPESFRLTAYIAFWIMIGVSVLTTDTVHESVVEQSPLKKKFGYNNICVYFDYQPAKTAAAMIYPFVEYPFLFYCIINGMAFFFMYQKGKLPRWQLICVAFLVPLQCLALAWFRMVFVEDAFVDGLKAHTAGFLSLQWALCLIAAQNHWYMYAAGHVPLREWFSAGYVIFVFVLTLLKQILAISILEDNPLWCVEADAGCGQGAAAAQAIDVIWMILLAVFPMVLAFWSRMKTPFLQFQVLADGSKHTRERGDTVVTRSVVVEVEPTPRPAGQHLELYDPIPSTPAAATVASVATPSHAQVHVNGNGINGHVAVAVPATTSDAPLPDQTPTHKESTPIVKFHAAPSP